MPFPTAGCRVQTFGGDLEGLNDKACATRPGLRLTFDSVRMQNGHREAGNNMKRSENKNTSTTSNRSAQPKGSITASRPWRAVDKHWRPFGLPIGQDKAMRR